MIITLELSPEVETKLRQSIITHDTESARQILADALIPTVEALLQQNTGQPDTDEFEVIADQLSEELAVCLGSDRPVLSDYAVSRAGIYENYP